MLALALLTAALVAAPPAAPAAAPPEPPLEIVDAGEIAYDVGAERWQLAGGATLRRGAVTVRADRATYDAKSGEVVATGGVLLTEPGRVLAASAMRLVLDGPFEAQDVVAFAKDGPIDLAACRTLDEAEAAGRNRVSFSGRSLAGEAGDPELRLSRPRVTLCDCGGGAPSWDILARSADVIPGKRAILWWPVFRITPRFLFVDRPIPVLALPAAWIPLAERQSGLLFPGVSFARTGFALSVPLYLTLGRSWDATVSWEQSFGAREGKLSVEGDVSRRTVRGTGAAVELRWAPAAATSGFARLRWLDDRARDVVDTDGDGVPDLVGDPHGHRLALTLQHDQLLAPRTRLRVDAALVNDPLYVQDFTADVLLRAVEYRRSALTLVHRRDDALFGLEAGYHLSFAGLGQQSFDADRSGTPRIPFGTFGADVPVLHRLPALTAALLPVRLVGPLTLSTTAQLARFAPLSGATGDEGADGLGPGTRGGPTRDAGEGDGRWQEGERLATTRATLLAELRAPFTVGEWLAIEPWTRAFAAGYAFDAGPDPLADGRLAAGLRLAAPVSRTFGEGTSRLRHDVEPRVEWRAGTGRTGPRSPSAAWDELDAVEVRSTDPRTLTATPSGGFHQLQLALRNRLRKPAGRPLSAELTIGQDVDLSGGRLAETFLDLGVQSGPVRAAAEARVHLGDPPNDARAADPSWLDDFSLLRATLAVGDARGNDVHASLVTMGPTGSESLAGGLEPFFASDPRAVFPVGNGTVGATVKLGAASATYDAIFNARTLAAPLCTGKTTAPHVYQHAATLGWDSPCRCFRVAVRAVLTECDPNPQVGIQIGLNELGGFGLGP